MASGQGAVRRPGAVRAPYWRSLGVKTTHTNRKPGRQNHMSSKTKRTRNGALPGRSRQIETSSKRLTNSSTWRNSARPSANYTVCLTR
eukprot:scaffold127077_cov69-Phaeocystis_antarctica.AAC.1